MGAGSPIGISLGVLSQTVPAPLIDAVLAETGRQSQRQRQLPARVVACCVITLALYARASYGEVLRCLLEGLRWLRGRRSSIPVASKSAIPQARTRLGAAPLKRLFERVAVPLADRQTPGAWYRGRRLVSLDGTTVDVANVPDNAAAFGRPAASRGRSGFPQLRLVALIETGPRAMIAVAAADSGTGEPPLARRVIGALSPDMLCLADRGFIGFAPRSQACATGAALLRRVRKNQVFTCACRTAPISASSTPRPSIAAATTASSCASSSTAWMRSPAPNRRTG